jgi:hypothetical protein
MNAEIDDLLSTALSAVHAAQAALRKGASPRDLDILRKANGLTTTDAPPRASSADDVLTMIDEANRRLDKLEGAR